MLLKYDITRHMVAQVGCFVDSFWLCYETRGEASSGKYRNISKRIANCTHWLRITYINNTAETPIISF